MVEEGSADNLEEANLSLNLRICNFLNNKKFDNLEVVRAIKKISIKNVMSHSLILDLLETYVMNTYNLFYDWNVKM